MITSIRQKFTEWYVKKGYTFGYDFSGTKVIGEYPFLFPYGVPKAYFDCPIWVKPFLFLFSPSVYQVKAIGDVMIKGFLEGLNDPRVKPINIDILLNGDGKQN